MPAATIRNLTYLAKSGLLSSREMARTAAPIAKESDCRLRDEKLLYDASNERNGSSSDSVGAARLRDPQAYAPRT
jgi:hypothetical protein